MPSRKAPRPAQSRSLGGRVQHQSTARPASPDLGTFRAQHDGGREGKSADRLRVLEGECGTQGHGAIDPLNIGSAFVEFLKRIAANPSALIEAQGELLKSYLDLWQNTAKRLMGYDVDPIVLRPAANKRFKHADWQQNQVFDFIKQSYLLTANWMQDTVGKVDGLDPKTQAKVKFYTKQFADAIATDKLPFDQPGSPARDLHVQRRESGSAD